MNELTPKQVRKLAFAASVGYFGGKYFWNIIMRALSETIVTVCLDKLEKAYPDVVEHARGARAKYLYGVKPKQDKQVRQKPTIGFHV